MKVRILSPRDEEVFLLPGCEYCSGNGRLVFFKCKACDRILLVCSELGCVYPDPHDTKRSSGLIHDDPPCPSCGATHVNEFLRATMDEVVALGFALSDLDSSIADEILQS